MKGEIPTTVTFETTDETEKSASPSFSLAETQEMEEESQEVLEPVESDTDHYWSDNQMDESAEDYIYENRKLNDEERLIVYEYFERKTESPKTDLYLLPETFLAVLSYWAVNLRVIDAKEERDVFINTKQEAMNLYEIKELEEKYIQLSKDKYGYRIIMEENKKRFKELVNKKELAEGERQELRELFRSCAQTRHSDYRSNITYSCLLSLYRTSGVPFTFHELKQHCRGSGYLWLRNLISKELLQVTNRSALLETLPKPPPASEIQQAEQL